MKNIEKLMDELGLEEHITLEDIPKLDLYMDQVIQLFESKYKSAKRDENDKILTKTMINNYAKGKLFIPIKNKKYSKEHLILISLIYQLKGALSIKDIKKLLDDINKKVEVENFSLDHFYESYLHLLNMNKERLKQDIMAKEEETNQEVMKLNEQETDYLEKVLFVSSLVNMSNLYRRVAEKLVDQLIPEEKEK